MIEDLRIIDSPIGPVIPVADICAQIGYSRSAATRVLQRHKDSFAGLHVFQRTETPAGGREALCLTAEGAERFIRYILPDATTRPALAARVEAFKEKARIAPSQATAAKVPALSGILTEYGKQAQALAEEWGVDLTIAQRVVMAAAVERFPDLTPYRALVGGNDKPPADVPALPAPVSGPQADPDYDRYFSLRKLAQFCQCDEKDARKILVDEGVVAYQNTHLILTRYGERFARVFTVTPEAPHRMYGEPRIRYNPDAIQLVRGKLFCIQTTLAQRTKVTG